MPSDLEIELRKAFYSPAEVAEFVGVSSSTVLNYIHAGKLASVRLSERTYRIPRKALLRLLDPASVRPTRHVDDPDAEVDLTEADREAPLLSSA
jgi:excisionase family DNA binding protein